MGARWKIHCSSIGITLVLMGCGASLCFGYGRSSSFKTKPKGLMDFFGNMFQQASQEDLLSWPNRMPSVSENLELNHWGLYQKPVQQPDYERHFYNFGEQGNDVCSDEGMDYSSLDFSCQEPDSNSCGCGDADSEYTDQPVDCNDDKYGIRWKGSPPEEANVEIDEMISKGWQSQWSTGGGVSEDTFEDEATPKSTPNFSGLTNVDVHKCFPQGGNDGANGLQFKTAGDEYFVLVIKKDQILGDAVKLNKTAISIDAIIGASLQPPNRSDSAPTDGTPLSHQGSSTQGSITAPTFTTTSQPRISSTKIPVSSTKTPTSTTARMPDEAVAQSPDEPTKVSVLENPKIASPTTPPAITLQPNYAETPTSPTSHAPASTSNSGSDGVASQSMDGPTKISLSSNPLLSADANTPLKPNNPIPTVIPSNYSPASTLVPPNSAPDLKPTDPPSIWSTSEKPIVIHTTAFADSQSEDPSDNNDTSQGPMNTPENIPQSPELGSSFVGHKPEVIVNNPAQVTIAIPGSSNTQPTEMSSEVPPVSQSSEGTTTTIVNDTSSPMGSPRPTNVAVSTTKTDVPPKTAIIVNDKPIVVPSLHPTNFGPTHPSDTASIVEETKSLDGNSAAVSTAESALDSEATIVNDMPPVVARPQPINVGLIDLSDSTQMVGKIKPVANSADSDLKPTTVTMVNDTQDTAVEKPQTSSSGSSHLNGPTVSNDSQSAESLHGQVVNRSSTEDSKSSNAHNHQLLTTAEKRPIQNKEYVLDSQFIDTASPKNVSEKEIIPTNFETTSSDPTNSQTFTVTISSNAALSVRETTKPTPPQVPKEFENNYPKTPPSVIETTFTVTTPVSSPPTTLNFSPPAMVGNSTRTSGSIAGVDIESAVAGSQSESSTSSPNISVNDVSTTASMESTPQFKISEASPSTENYNGGTTVTTPVISGHNIQDIGHTIKGLQDLVNKLMSTVNSPATPTGALSSDGIPKPQITSANTVTRPHSTEQPPESEIGATVNDSTEPSKITIPKGETIADGFQEDLSSTLIVSASNPSVPTMETSAPSVELTPSSQSTNSHPHIEKDDKVPSANASIAIGVNTPPPVLNSQSPMSTHKPVMSLTSDDPPVENDSPRMGEDINSYTKKLPGKSASTVNGTTLSSEDPSTIDESALLSVTKLDDKEPDNLGSSTPYSAHPPTIVNDNTDNGGSKHISSATTDSSYNGSSLQKGVRDEMSTTTPTDISQLPDSTVNQINVIDSGRPSISDKATPSNEGVTDKIPTPSGKASSPSPDLMTPSPLPAPSATDSNGTQTAANTSDSKNPPDVTNSSQSPEVIPVMNSTNTLSSSPPDPVTVKEPVEPTTGSTPVTFTESSYDASSFTSTNDPVPTEETTKSSSRPKGIHKILSFMSWMRGKKSADNATENAATQLTESAFDPIEEIIETSDNDLPVVDKDIFPENLANWFLGFHSAEDEDTSHMSDVNESQSSEVPDANLEFNDLYHNFLESAIHNINNSSSIVNASEPIGTPFSWWSRFRGVEDAHNNILKKSPATDAVEAGSQTPTPIDRGFMEGAIHKVNDASPILNGSDSTWKRWMTKLKGYKNMLKSSLTLNGPTSETNQSSLVGTIHNSDDGSRVAKNMEKPKGESSWFSKFWSTKSGHDNSTSAVNTTQTAHAVKIETGGHNKSYTAESSVSTNETSIGSNATTGDVTGSQSGESSQDSTASIAKTNNTEVDDESSTVKIIFTKPKAEWMSLLADIQAAQEGSLPTVNGTEQQTDARSEGKANATSASPRMYSHFHGSDFEVWSGEHV